jgi:hypothetical protein
MADHHLSQSINDSGTDQVLVGNSVRDRFLTAFILQQNGFAEIVCPLEVMQAPSDEDALLFSLELAELENQDWLMGEREGEPLSIRLVEIRYPDDDEDV